LAIIFEQVPNKEPRKNNPKNLVPEKTEEKIALYEIWQNYKKMVIGHGQVETVITD